MKNKTILNTAFSFLVISVLIDVYVLVADYRVRSDFEYFSHKIEKMEEDIYINNSALYDNHKGIDQQSQRVTRLQNSLEYYFDTVIECGKQVDSLNHRVIENELEITNLMFENRDIIEYIESLPEKLKSIMEDYGYHK